MYLGVPCFQTNPAQDYLQVFSSDHQNTKVCKAKPHGVLSVASELRFVCKKNVNLRIHLKSQNHSDLGIQLGSSMSWDFKTSTGIRCPCNSGFLVSCRSSALASPPLANSVSTTASIRRRIEWGGPGSWALGVNFEPTQLHQQKSWWIKLHPENMPMIRKLY